MVGGQLDEEDWLGVRYVSALSFCRLLLIIKYMLYVLLFDVLFDLSVRQFVFLRLCSREIIQYHPFGMSQGWGLLSQLLSLPLRSVRLPRSDALPPAQPVYACVSWLKGVGRFSSSPKTGIC